MSDIIDSYSESNADTPFTVCGSPTGATRAFGQTFTGNGEQIVSARFYIGGHANPTGNAFAKIWTMTGTFGTNGNAGTLLATSDATDVSTFGAAALRTFMFSGANQYTTVNATKYVVTCEYDGGSTSTFNIEVHYDSTGTHPGNFVFQNVGDVYTGLDAGIDTCFYVDGVAAGFAGLYRL